MNGAIGEAIDKAVFLGTGANGQPLGVITGQSTYGITATDAERLACWSAVRAAVVRFMAANAAGSPGAVRGAHPAGAVVAARRHADHRHRRSPSGTG